MDEKELSERIRLDLAPHTNETLSVRKVFWMGYLMACVENNIITEPEFARMMHGSGKLF